MKTLKDLFTHEIQDLYSAEKQLLEALPKMSRAAKSDELIEALNDHLGQTEDHVARLKEIFEQLGMAENGADCKGMEGLIAEGEEILSEDLPEDLIDAALIGAGQRVEHYEIAAYGTARAHAVELGLDEAADLLEMTLDEESAADRKLTRIAETIANPQAENGNV